MRHAYDSMRATAIEGMALIEALIDFGEDEGISDGVFEQGTFGLISHIFTRVLTSLAVF